LYLIAIKVLTLLSDKRASKPTIGSLDRGNVFVVGIYISAIAELSYAILKDTFGEVSSPRGATAPTPSKGVCADATPQKQTSDF
jgi:hypothetical protein